MELLNYTPKVHLFAGNVNHQFHAYCSYKPNWAFPPFSIIPEVLKKINADNADGILAVPSWPNQPWFSLIFKMLTDAPVLLTLRKHLLHLPKHLQTLHSIWRKKDLLVCHLAGFSQKTAGYLKKLRHHQSIMEILNKAKVSGLMYKFLQFCLQRNVNPAQVNFQTGIEYLTSISTQG